MLIPKRTQKGNQRAQPNPIFFDSSLFPLPSIEPNPTPTPTQHPTNNNGPEPPQTEPLLTTLIVGFVVAVALVAATIIGLLGNLKKRGGRRQA
jgi:hypothetical protein